MAHGWMSRITDLSINVAIILWIPCAALCDFISAILARYTYLPERRRLIIAGSLGHLLYFLAAASIFYGWDTAAAAAAKIRGDVLSPPIVQFQITLTDSIRSCLTALIQGAFVSIAASILLIGQCVRCIIALFLVAPRIVVAGIIIIGCLMTW